jgi:hypothetical protein
MKKVPWYGFKKPADTERDVMRAVARAAFVLMTDFSAYDSTHGKFMVDFELQLMQAIYGPAFTLTAEQYQTTGFTRWGVQYSVGNSRLSGSPDTSLFNTLDNALVAYIVYREMGKPSSVAWNSLGVYGGDDGLSPEADIRVYTKVSDTIGMLLTEERVEANEYLTFLGRTYVNPWITPNNMMDIPRYLGKFHYVRMPEGVPAQAAVHWKYSQVVRSEPVYSLWYQEAKAILAKHGRIRPDKLEKHSEQLETGSDRFWQSHHTGPYSHASESEMHAALAHFGVCVQSWRQRILHLNSANCNSFDLPKVAESSPLKQTMCARVGDTITHCKDCTCKSQPGYRTLVRARTF